MRESKTRAQGPSPRILIVDDEPTIVELLRIGLNREGFEAEAVTDAAAAFDRMREARYDLVVLDATAPGMDAFEICRRMRAVGDVLILVLTAREGTRDRVKGLHLGADDCVIRPVGMAELAARLRALLRRRGSESAKGAVFGRLSAV